MLIILLVRKWGKTLVIQLLR